MGIPNSMKILYNTTFAETSVSYERNECHISSKQRAIKMYCPGN
jgi:hypothetical protein